MHKEIEKAAEVVRNGGVILYPTDTIWGLGCDPNNEEAINKILEIKNRPANKSLIVLVPNEQLLNRYVKEIPEVCYDLIDFAEKPLTIVYPEGQYLSDKITAEDGSVAIRMTKDEYCKKLMLKLKSGIVSTSANVSGNVSAVSVHDVDQEIKEKVDYVVDLPDYLGSGVASQIIKIGDDSSVEIIRK